jgi:membrane-bound lytic murein transglycosylase B
MSQKRLSSWQKATALVPLALLSGAWTANLSMTSTASAATRHDTLPDGSDVPGRAFKTPASLTVPGEIAPGVPDGAQQDVIDASSSSGIPAAALGAYRRAAEVINQADPSCRMQWQLIAAIGRVESDHGRYGGSTLGSDGVSRPGIYGIPLDGSDGTAQVADTDAGQYDDDPVYDRAMGPMQFIPSTWSVVGVDGDGDGKRNPQDIDDAALATAVYLCAGKDDLSTSNGQRAAVYRYNHSQDYVDLVLSIMRAYLAGDFSAVPNGSTAPTVFAPVEGSVRPARNQHSHAHHARTHRSGSSSRPASSGGSGGSGSGSGGGGTAPAPAPAPAPAGGGGGGGGGGSVGGATGGATQAVDKTKQATEYCKAQLAGKGASASQLQKCVDAFVSGGKAAADNVIAGILSVLGIG